MTTNGRLEVSPRRRAALEAICDTFVPGAGEAPAASKAGVPDAVLEAVAANPREAERKQFEQLLGLWDTALLTALGGGGLKKFSKLPLERREEVLLSWGDSRLSQRRAAFQALRKGAPLMYYMLQARQAATTRHGTGSATPDRTEPSRTRRPGRSRR